MVTESDYIYWFIIIAIIFSGVGKGVVGLVARPTGGVIDFASGTFDSVKRVTENQEEIRRVRPPRFLYTDGIVRNYNFKEATGWKYLRELDKGMSITLCTFH